MRTTQTFVLRLFVDTDDPAALRGALRRVAEDDEHPFSDEASLMSLLRGARQSAEQDDGVPGAPGRGRREGPS